MNTRTRTALQAMKAPSKNERAKQKMEMGRSIEAQKAAQTRRCSRRDRKMALQQDVDKLRKKLKHEENVHRALERAFTRPLGALPRLPPYLPPYTLELLAEVAVLEEEVVRLEEQVVNFRQSLYQEAVHISSSKKHSNIDNRIDFCDPSSTTIKAAQPKSSCRTNSESSATMPRFLPSIDDEDPHRVVHCSHHHANGKQPSCNREPKKLHTCSATLDDRRGKENQQHSNTVMNNKQSRRQVVASRNYPKRSANTQDKSMVEKQSNLSKLQPECREVHDRATQECSADGAGTVKEVESSGPNKISEEILKCLLSIFLRLSREPVQMESETMPGTTTRLDCSGSSSSTATSSCKVPIMNCAKDIEYRDPYGICSEFGERGIGPYKHLSEIGSSSIDLNQLISSGFLIQRLELLLGKLSSVDLRGLSHQKKLAFWINIYNSCMMHAFLEYGIPDSPQMVVALMQKAIINVSGCSLSALTIEHFILRLPYHTSSVYAESRGMKNIDTVTMRSVFGLDWPEPLVTFALSCGSWSSPAVRVYTAGNVEKELDDAKRDYLQAAVGINNNRLGIPKLLDWYLLDFAKDMGSLLDWICLQLPNVLRKEAVKCVERGRRDPLSKTIQILPYDFNFRYLLPAP